MNSASPSLSPVRIYVLWHPGFDDREEFRGRDLKTLSAAEKARHNRGLKLARRIYHWFRMENMEGIPVYFRSAPAQGTTVEPPPIHDDPGVRNYIIPLVDAHMVSCPEWRAYVKHYADLDDTPQFTPRRKSKADPPVYRVLPVAVESVAYNMPESMRRLNFIRHIAGQNGRAPDDMQLIAKLTEVLCRDLRSWIDSETSGKARTAVPGKIKIFLSHAKADDTDEAVELKEFIQRETQCEAFFDETDIASGYDYTGVLHKAITEDSAGLIVIQSDNYADRPWCRKEIRDFLKPLPDPLATGTGRLQFFIPPVVVVQTMKGKQIARTIAELGYSPCVHWQPGAARFVVTTLLREILFGLFYRALAKRIGERDAAGGARPDSLYINRAPDPVMINRILKQLAEIKNPGATTTTKEETGTKECVHPGYGLSNMEKEGLETAVSGVTFSSFLGRSAQARPLDVDLTGKIIAVSVGNATDILSLGLADEHTRELLVRVLRPLLRQQVSILYAGRLPESLRPEEPWNDELNFTGALLHLLLSERATGQVAGRKSARLYIPKEWSAKSSVNAHTIAQWTDICTFVMVPAEDAGIAPAAVPAKPVSPPSREEMEDLNDEEKRALKARRSAELKAYETAWTVLKVRCYSAMRRKICDTKHPLTCTHPDDTAPRQVKTFAHIILGGKTTGFTGIMPGVFEEILHAFKARKPVFLIAGYGGSSALIASWLLDPPKMRPAELTIEHYEKSNSHFALVRKELDQRPPHSPANLTPQAALDTLWNHIQTANKAKDLATLFRNGLDNQQNRDLLTSESTGDICRLVWEGCSKIAKTGSRQAASPK